MLGAVRAVESEAREAVEVFDLGLRRRRFSR